MIWLLVAVVILTVGLGIPWAVNTWRIHYNRQTQRMYNTADYWRNQAQTYPAHSRNRSYCAGIADYWEEDAHLRNIFGPWFWWKRRPADGAHQRDRARPLDGGPFAGRGPSTRSGGWR